MEEDKNCFFCNSICILNTIPSLSYSNKYCCSYCGEYLLDRQDSRILSGQSDSKFKIACVLNERRLKGLGGVALSNKTDKVKKVCGYPQVSIDDILDEFPKKASDFLNRTLLNLSRLATLPFEGIRLDLEIDCLNLFAPDRKGCYAFLRELAQQGFIRFNEVKAGTQFNFFFLTNKCWDKIENLKIKEKSRMKQSKNEEKAERSVLTMPVRSSKDNWEDIKSEYDISKRDFGKKINFVSDSFKRKVIFRDVEHAFVLASEGFAKPAVILAGGVIEELLRLYLKHKNIAAAGNTFNEYIKACEQNKLLQTGIGKLSDSAREFRNFVHLSKESTKKHSITKAAAKGSVSSIFTIANDL
ncbi:MAG TPA: hypothetical protein VMW72_08990 [Sedimentisphaerales bacterium]|nr:hypothetical protein [Sedimentisphaerales bacterium]